LLVFLFDIPKAGNACVTNGLFKPLKSRQYVNIVEWLILPESQGDDF